MTDIRLQCARTIQKILEDKIFFSELKKEFSEDDLPFANMLILTSLRYWVALNKALAQYIRKKIPNKHRLAEYLIKLAMTELLFMKTPAYAVINQTTQNVKQNCDKFLGGLANAVLRKISQQKEDVLRQINNTNLLPESFLKLLEGYSAEDIKQISESIKETVPLDITVKDETPEWQKKLNAELLPNGTLRIFSAAKIKELPQYNEGKWWVQDVAAALPVAVCGNIKDKKVIDLCAAPGGKTAQLAAKGAMVTALDISEKRMETLKQNMQRLEFDNINTLAIDAVEYMNRCTDKYDVVLLDAPCSASGTFRRHPEVIHIKDATDVREASKIQQKLLDLCPLITEKGSIVIYSVCSICKEEGEKQINDFLARHKEFKKIAITSEDISPFGNWKQNFINSDGEIRTLPHYLKSLQGMDSFFICKMKRII